MKTAKLLLAVVCASSLALARGFAAESAVSHSRLPSRAKSPFSARPGNPSRPPTRATEKKSQPGPLNLQNRRPLADPSRQTEAGKAGPGGKAGLSSNKNGIHPLPGAQSEAPRAPVAPASGIVRDRGAATATLGGLAKPGTTRSAGSISGTGVKRRF
jgi:hypothetical protein